MCMCVRSVFFFKDPQNFLDCFRSEKIMCQRKVKLAMLAAAAAVALLFTAQVNGQQWAEQQFVQTLGPDVATGFASCISNDWDQLDTCWQQTDCVSDYYGFDDIVNCYQQYNCDTSNLGYCVQNYPIVVNTQIQQPQFQPQQQQQFQPQPQQQQPQTYYPGNNNFQPMYPQNYPQNYPQQQQPQQPPAPYDQPTQYNSYQPQSQQQFQQQFQPRQLIDQFNSQG